MPSFNMSAQPFCDDRILRNTSILARNAQYRGYVTFWKKLSATVMYFYK